MLDVVPVAGAVSALVLLPVGGPALELALVLVEVCIFDWFIAVDVCTLATQRFGVAAAGHIRILALRAELIVAPS